MATTVVCFGMRSTVAMKPGRAFERGALDQQALVGVDLVLEPAHAAIEQPIDRVRLPRAQPAHVDRRRNRRDQHRRIGALHHVVLEQVRQSWCAPE